ncbi:hypothetical protein RLON56S_03119 [Alishewanella longhuensis]
MIPGYRFVQCMPQFFNCERNTNVSVTRERQLLAFQDNDGGFIELTPQGLQLNQSILLRKRDVELQFPPGTDALWLAALLWTMAC